ncbi:tRNA epoxyqueuosine(34) reductase QueG [Leptolyngbya sp. FACHB-261]|uniref:tRNA epoxyqueuosine(34) reductase QueG n=1 Tax=Leptolyngbya sp. FACHB-261 TaxID=2692806 RepID=UPI00168483C9|nr:tRNA epoxyqueuosine(34) reductase QueG [Leptolyngbya sp. FACHB-261]MBD2100592.1 tRNA epoxyqueuosine(34) reductase QueG [Leptolyngbya sp. FACHB-261]
MNRPSALQIKQKAQELGFHRVGIATVNSEQPGLAQLQAWLAAGQQADMAWMSDPRRQEIIQVLPGVKSLICVALNYYTPHEHSQDPNHAKISRYGWGRDYHRVLSKRLKALSTWLEAQAEDIKTRFYADTGPVQDKAWAQRAGIGWVGKHGNVISRDYGSWLFLGEVLTTLELESDQPHTEHCGSCTRCLDACPTNAIVQPFTVDARRCIAYHTIENRAPELPSEIADKMHNWVAGCDICQDVCPWNQRFAKPTDVPDFQPYAQNLAPSLSELAQITPEQWDERFQGSALRRIKPEMLRRNAQANLSANQPEH